MNYDAGQNFASLDTAFGETNYSSSIDFKLVLDKYKTSRNNVVVGDKANNLLNDLGSIRRTLEDNYRMLYNHQSDIIDNIKIQMETLTPEEKETYLAEFSKNFDFDTDAYFRMTQVAVSKLREVKAYQSDCELKIAKQNKTLDKLKELFDKLMQVSEDTDITNPLASFKKSLDDISTNIQAEKETLNKDLIRALLYTEFASQQISDPLIKNLTIYGCPVCLENQINAFIPSCGHTGCNDCLTKAKDCPVCRGHKKEVKPLYFSGNELAKRDIKPIGIRPGIEPGFATGSAAGQLLGLNNALSDNLQMPVTLHGVE